MTGHHRSSKEKNRVALHIRFGHIRRRRFDPQADPRVNEERRAVQDRVGPDRGSMDGGDEEEVGDRTVEDAVVRGEELFAGCRYQVLEGAVGV